ncbi:hypothetical protein ACS0TY_009130 [Phlomoides rotata]
MFKEEEKEQASGVSWKTYSRSVSWTERSPRKSDPIPNPRWNRKARACLPPLQPLSIARPSIEQWPRAGSDDLGIWPHPPTPGAKPGSITPRENSTADQPPREFECRKDKIAFFDKECSRILEHIYLGSDAIAKNREILRQSGITHVLNCVGFVCHEYFKNDLVYRTLWLKDSPSEDITSILYDVFDYFEDVREQGGRVLVHCCHGVSRSTSLVIAYIMWKEGQSFDDAFQYVKEGREVANPNVGFACQLLQCQKRVHALPASPTSVLRMYHMAPHSPHDPLHLVPKMLCEPGADRLDSRGAFIVHIPSALYVWIGKHCSPVMSDNAMTAASQVIRYERAKGPILIIKEGEETFGFWDAFSCTKGFAEGCHGKSEEKSLSAGSDIPRTVIPCLNIRKVDEYDLDFEIFHKALGGGVVPPFPLSEAGPETCLPARESDWNRLRKKFVDGIVKEFIASSKPDPSVLQRRDELETRDTCSELEETLSPTNLSSTPSSSLNDSRDSFASCVASSFGSDTSPSESPSYNLVDSFSSFFVSKPKSDSTSPSVSPSTSDYSSSFSFSPSSSNWSDLSFASAQPSPHVLEPKDTDRSKSGSTNETLDSVDESICLHDTATSPLSGEGIPASHVSRAEDWCSTSGQALPSLECRGSSFPSWTILPSIDEESHISENLPRYMEDDVMTDAEYKNLSRENSLVIDREEPISDANHYAADGEALSTLRDEKNFGTKITDALYVWVGRDVTSRGSHSHTIRYGSKYVDIHAHLERVGRSLLLEEGFSPDAQIKIVEEWVQQLLEHLACFSLDKDLDSRRSTKCKKIHSQSHGLSAAQALDNYSVSLSHSHTHTHTPRPVLTSRCTVQPSLKPKTSHAEWSYSPNLKLAYSPKRATAELRHSSSIGNRATVSPAASAVASSPFSSDYDSVAAADDDHNGRDRYSRDRSFRSYIQPFLPHYCFPNDDLYRAHPYRSKISILILVAVALAAVISVSSVIKRLNAPYLCRKDGITLHCPHVKEPPSLWENPYSATTSWKPCAERHEGIISDLPAENETNGYIFIHAEGGLNQQRIAICNAVAVAKIMNATLILPVLKQDQIWKDQTKFEDIFDVDHFIDYLKDDVRIVRDIPEWFTDKTELFSSIRRTVKNIPKYAPAQFYIDNVLPRVKEKKIMALKPFVDRLGYDNVPQEINRLRCRVNYHALKFLPEIENMADLLVSRMRNRTGSSNPFMALHLRFEKGMVGLSFCDFVGTRVEKALMALYRLKEWPRRFKDGSHLWALALQKRKEGRCPLEPGEVAVMLRAMGYPKETQIYVASGQVYGGQNRMAPLRNMFPNHVSLIS